MSVLTALTGSGHARDIRQGQSREGKLLTLAILGLAAFLALFLLLPLWSVFSRSFLNAAGDFVGIANYAEYFSNPALFTSAWNSIWISTLSAGLVLVLAFGYAYALTRTCLPLKGVFRAISFIPILAPSLLPAISLVYLFGNQGMAMELLLGHSIYGPIGIVMGEVFWAFPHALIILIVALSSSDARLYEAASALNAGPWRTFRTVTLPGARYGIVSAFFVAFTLIITDFGVPKVIGGQTDVLATEVYKQVVGRQDFEMGAVVGIVLLIPAVIAFTVDRIVQRRQVALISARAVPLVPRPKRLPDLAALIYCCLIAAIMVTVVGVAIYASLIRFWPYNLELTWANYQFDLMDGGGWASYWNSLRMAAWTALVGTLVVFTGAWLTEKVRSVHALRTGLHLLAMMPMAIPGLVLGLAYVFFFNAPDNPLNVLYHTMAILVLSTIVHYYTVSHLTAITALKQIDPEFEAVSESLKVPLVRTFARVTVPVCAPAILDISIYFFVNAMTTISAVVFLYGPDTTLASVAMLNMDDAGDIAPAAAMGVLIFFTSALVRVVHAGLGRAILGHTQGWRRT